MIPQLQPHAALEAQQEGALIVDVREAHEWEQSRIPNAMHIPLSRFMAEYQKLPKDQLLILQCAVGGRSQQAAGYLYQQGFQVANLSGGIQAWAAMQLPLD